MMAPFPAAATAAAIHLILVECQRMKGYIYGSMVHGGNWQQLTSNSKTF